MIGATLFGILSSNPTVVGLVGRRIYPHIQPQDGQLPALVYTVVDEVPENTLQGFTSGLKNATVQIDVYAKGYVAAQAVAAAVEGALSRYQADNLAVLQVTRRDSYEDDTMLYRSSFDYSMWLKES